MRFVLALVLLGGCLIEEPQDDGYYGGGSGGGGSWGSGWGGGDGAFEDGCASDAACGGGLVCTRTRECLDPSQVRAVHALWTVGGEPAAVGSCRYAPDLSITFSSAAGEQFGYTPVPCEAGKFTVDKLPIRFGTVQLTRAYDYEGGDAAAFDAAGDAQLDLPY